MVDMANVTVLKTLVVTNPIESAMWAQTFLAVDKGVPSEIVRAGSSRIVVADDNRAIRFDLKGGRNDR